MPKKKQQRDWFNIIWWFVIMPAIWLGTIWVGLNLIAAAIDIANSL